MLTKRRSAGLSFFGDHTALIGNGLVERPEGERKGATVTPAGTAMVERTKVTYPQARDARSELFARFGGRQLPHTVVVDASGHLAARHNKVITSRAELDAMIDEAR